MENLLNDKVAIVTGAEGLQDGKIDAAGRSGDDGGFSLQHLGASSGVPCPESAFQCLSIHAFAFIHVHVHYAGPKIVRRPSMGEDRPGR